MLIVGLVSAQTQIEEEVFFISYVVFERTFVIAVDSVLYHND